MSWQNHLTLAKNHIVLDNVDMKADEEIPKRPRGRPIRAVSLADCLEKREARDVALTCSMCPKWKRRGWWCVILAEVRSSQRKRIHSRRL